MVASSKLHHAQVMIENMLPYETMLERILKSFLASEVDAKTIFSQERKVNRVALIVFSSNSSLCGGFNANIIKSMLNAIEEYKANGISDFVIYPIGRKVAEKVNKLNLPSVTILTHNKASQSHRKSDNGSGMERLIKSS